MAIYSNPLGSVWITGDDAKAFTRRIRRGRGTAAATAAMVNGDKLVVEFDRRGSVTITPRVCGGLAASVTKGCSRAKRRVARASSWHR